MGLFTKDKPHATSALYSPERVESLLKFVDVLVENAARRRERVDLVAKLLELVEDADTIGKIRMVADESVRYYPGHNIDVSLIDSDTRQAIATKGPDPYLGKDATGVIPLEETYCRFTIAAGRPVEVLDSRVDLIVCSSPHREIARSYLGAPLIVRTWAVGVFCLYSATPRAMWTDQEKYQVSGWAARVSDILELALLGH